MNANIYLDLRSFNNSFVRTVKGTSGVEKRCIIIPIEDNFIEEDGFIKNNGEQVKTATVTLRMWEVKEEDRAKYGKKEDYDLKLTINKKGLEALRKENPTLAAQMDYNNPNYSKEEERRHLPYVGRVFNDKLIHTKEEEGAATILPNTAGDDDIPY